MIVMSTSCGTCTAHPVLVPPDTTRKGMPVAMQLIIKTVTYAFSALCVWAEFSGVALQLCAAWECGCHSGTSRMRGVTYSEWRIPRECLGALLLLTLTCSGVYAPGPGVLWESVEPVKRGRVQVHTTLCLD